jgi:hypothetical protein
MTVATAVHQKLGIIMPMARGSDMNTAQRIVDKLHTLTELRPTGLMAVESLIDNLPNKGVGTILAVRRLSVCERFHSNRAPPSTV